MSYLSAEAQRLGTCEFDIPFSRQQLAEDVYKRQVHVLLLTGAKTPAQKRAAREKIAAGEAQLIVGTHALISTLSLIHI